MWLTWGAKDLPVRPEWKAGLDQGFQLQSQGHPCFIHAHLFPLKIFGTRWGVPKCLISLLRPS